MSGSFSALGKFSRKFSKADEDKQDEEKQGEEGNGDGTTAPRRRRRAAKENPLLSAQTDNYADDSDIYLPRLSRAQRYKFWIDLQQSNGGRKRPLPRGFKGWITKEFETKNELLTFPYVYVLLFSVSKSRFWDQLYLNLLILWLLLIVFFLDGWAAQFAPFLLPYNAGNQLLTLPPLLMFASQLVPVFSAVYFTHNCYDLVHFLAVKDFQKWACSTALIAQYIEFFYYGGRRRSHKAGLCRYGHQTKEGPVRMFLGRYLTCLRTPGGKYRTSDSKVHPTAATVEEIDEEEKEGEEEGEHGINEMVDEGEEVDLESGVVRSKRSNPDEAAVTTAAATTSTSSKKQQQQQSRDDDDAADAEADDFDVEESRRSSGAEDNDIEEDDIDIDDAEGGTSSRSSKKKRKKKSKKKSKKNKRKKDGDGFEFKSTDEAAAAAESIEYIDWSCIVCKQQNHQPKNLTAKESGADVVFGETGVHYKRLYARIQQRRLVASCAKCGTHCDYQPPLGSAHFFPHNQQPHVAFSQYPTRADIQSGLTPTATAIYWNHARSFFFGMRDDMRSGAMHNDWRLRKYASDRFPEVPRYGLQQQQQQQHQQQQQRQSAGEQFKLGEIVECRQQKFEWTRCRVILVRANRTYDVRYDFGDELRFVAESAIRTRPEKRAFAYRVEICFVLLSLLTPLGAALAFLTNDFGFILLGALVVSALLLTIRIVLFVQYFYNYYAAGMCTILRLTAVFTLPLLFVLIASALGVSSGTAPMNWPSVAVLFAIGMFSSLPACYMLRPPYAIIGCIVFLQVTVGMYLVGEHVNDPTANTYLGIALAPFFTCALSLKYLRYHLHNIWDVCLIIRPTSDTSRDNPSIIGMCWDYISDYCDCF